MMQIEFNALWSPVWIATLALMLLAAFAWLEIKRKQKLLPLRLIAVGLAILALAGLALNPSRSVNQSAQTILLTPGYNPQVFDSLKLQGTYRVYKLNSVRGTNNAEPVSIRDLRALTGSIAVLGEGIPDYALDYLDTSAVRYFPAAVTHGIVQINTKKTHVANQENTLEGMHHATYPCTITLSINGVAEDSVSLPAGLHPFALTFTPKAPGQFMYSLTEKDSAGNVQTERVPIDVKNSRALSILFLSDYPTAEIRFLKNYLETQQHKLTLRYRITRDRYRTEFINTQRSAINRITTTTLQPYDLVITDASSLVALSAAEVEALTEATSRGLGVMALLDDPAPAQKLLNVLHAKSSRIKSDSARISLNRQRIKLPAVPMELSFASAVSAIHREAGGRIVSGYTSHGLGKTGFQLFTNTFSLQLSGQHDAYATLWSRAITEMARKEQRAYDLTLLTPFPVYPDEPITFRVVSNAEKPIVTLDAEEIPIQEDLQVKNVWYGKIWAGQPGWHSLIIKQDSGSHNFSVATTDEWKNTRRFQQRARMEQLASGASEARNAMVQQRISPSVFFILFLLGAALLWLAPKL